MDVKFNVFVISVLTLLSISVVYGQYAERSWLEDVPEIHPTSEDSAFGAVVGSIRDHLYDVHLVKMDSEGRIEWSRVYAEDSVQSKGYYVSQTADGGFILTGASGYRAAFKREENTPWITKLDSKGNPIWKTKLPRVGYSCPSHVEEIPAGYIITGTFAPSVPEDRLSDFDEVLLAVLDTSGKVVFDTSYYCGIDTFSCVAGGRFADRYSNGGYLVFAEAGCPLDSEALGLVYVFSVDSLGRFDSLEGNDWRYIISREKSPCGFRICEIIKTSKGNKLILGKKRDEHDNSIWLSKYDPEQGLLWTRTWHVEQDEYVYPHSIVECPGGYVICKDSIGFLSEEREPGWGNCYDYVGLTKIDRKGKVLWSRYYGEHGHYNPPYSVKGLVQMRDKGFLTALFSKNVVGYSACWLVKTDHRGNPEWRRNVPGYSVQGIQATRDGGFIMIVIPSSYGPVHYLPDDSG